MGNLYLSTNYKLYRSTNNTDLSSDRNHWTYRDRHMHTHTETESDTLPIYDVGSSKKNPPQTVTRPSNDAILIYTMMKSVVTTQQ